VYPCTSGVETGAKDGCEVFESGDWEENDGDLNQEEEHRREGRTIAGFDTSGLKSTENLKEELSRSQGLSPTEAGPQGGSLSTEPLTFPLPSLNPTPLCW
jgi:hypothetical protein